MNRGKSSVIKFAFFSILSMLAISHLYAQNPALEWVKGAGGSSYDYSNSIKVDKAGNVYTTGIFHSDTILGDFGSKTFQLSSNGSEDVFLFKQNAAGDLIWAKSFGGALNDYSAAVAVDDSGNVFVTGSYAGDVDFDPGPNQEMHTSTWGSRSYSPDLFISKFDSAGNFVWVKVAGGNGGDMGNAIAWDTVSKALFVTGQFSGQVDFELVSGTNTFNTQSYDPFVVKLLGNGDLIWVRQLSGDNGGAGLGIALDPSGNIYTVGHYSGIYDFDPDSNNTSVKTSGGFDDIFIVKLDTGGKFVWANAIGGSGSDVGNAIAIDKSSNVYCTGFFQDAVNFNPNGAFTMTSLGLSDIFVSKLDKDGKFVWAKRAGNSSWDVGKAIALDELGNVYTTGHFAESQTDFNPGDNAADTFRLTADGTADAFIWKLNSKGEFVWALNIGGPEGGDAGLGIAVTNGYIHTTGAFDATVNFAPAGSKPALLTSVQYEDIFVLKFLDCASFVTPGIAGPDSVCLNGSYAYSFDVPGASSYAWELPVSWTGSSSAGTINAVAHGAGTIKVTAMGQCDTVVQFLDVELAMPKATINVKGFVLGTTDNNYTSWQWYQEGVKIEGATGSTYTVLENGQYSVVVTGGKGCTDTASYLVTNVSIREQTDLSQHIRIYPNPAKDIVYITSPIAVDIALVNIEGKLIEKVRQANQVSLNGWSNGIYFLQVYSQEGALIKVEKIVKGQ